MRDRAPLPCVTLQGVAVAYIHSHLRDLQLQGKKPGEDLIISRKASVADEQLQFLEPQVEDVASLAAECPERTGMHGEMFLCRYAF